MGNVIQILNPRGQHNIIDPIHGAISFSELEGKIINHEAFQRLRKIKQLGTAHLIFPGATHTRFAHSVGVMHMAGRLFDSIFSEARSNYASKPFSTSLEILRQTVRLSGLMHDLGHGPFSHVFEKCLVKFQKGFKEPKHILVSELDSELSIRADWLRDDFKVSFFKEELAHEHLSLGLIKLIFLKIGHGLPGGICPQDICSLLDDRISPSSEFLEHLKEVGKVFKSDDTSGLQECLKAILSSDLDADRLDYLQRDSQFCGTDIAGVDLDHLLSSLSLRCTDRGEFYISIKRNALASIEQVLISRKHMFDQVYLHRLNGLFGVYIESIVVNLVRKGLVDPPLSYKKFLLLTDEYIEYTMSEAGKNHSGKDLKKAIAFYKGRKTFEKATELVVPSDRVNNELSVLATRYDADYWVYDFNLKEFSKLDRDNASVNSSKIRVESIFQKVEAMPINSESEVFKSSLWRTRQSRVVVFKALKEADFLRRLQAINKISIHHKKAA